MLAKQTEKLKFSLAFLLLCFCTTAAVIPSFTLTGKFFLQNATVLVIAFAVFLASNLLNLKPQTVAAAVRVSICFWILYAVVWQINSHIVFHDSSFHWRYLFFYDKIMSVYMLWASFMIFYTAKLFTEKNKNPNIDDYKSFYSLMSKIFIFLFILTFIYCFFLCRNQSDDIIPFNFKPFEAFKHTFLSGKFDYEQLIYFFGNIVIFMPIGALLSLKIKNIPLQIILPVLISVAIEIMQYYFRLGFGDIDDIILNALGSYAGTAIVCLFKRFMKNFDLL